LEWGAPGYEDVVRTLASRKPELVLAGDDSIGKLQCMRAMHNSVMPSHSVCRQLPASVSHSLPAAKFI
jgi:hypothetical protein